MNSFHDRLTALCKRFDRAEGERSVHLESSKSMRAELAKTKEEFDLETKVSEVLQASADLVREDLKRKIEDLVTKGIRAVFGRHDMSFEFEISSANSLDAKPVLVTGFGDKVYKTSIVGNHAGGVADVVAFILRVVVLAMARPRMHPVVVLDESFRHVSPNRLRAVAGLVKELSDSAGVQFVIVTHKEELLDAADVIYRASMNDKGVTSFKLEHDMRDDEYHAAPSRDPVARPKNSFLETSLEEVFSGAKLYRDGTLEDEDVLSIKQKAKEASKGKRAYSRRKREGQQD